jgi:calmodulin-binding transcription activator
LDSQFQQNLEYEPPGRLDSSDLRIQLSAAKRFLLGPEDSIDSPSSNFVLGNVGNSGTGILSGHDGRLESSLNPELFGHGQFEPFSRADTRLTLGKKRLFNIREISPEWAFSYQITKVNHDVLRFLILKPVVLSL